MMHRFALLVLVLLTWITPARAEIVVWHAYRGAEEKALQQLAERARAEGMSVELLSVPFGAYASKLEGAIKLGRGPDVFLDAHERLGSYLAQGLLAPLPLDVIEHLARHPREVAPEDLEVLRKDGILYGLPLAHKTLALYVNEALLPELPASFDALLAARPGGARYGVVYESGSAYFHAGFLHAFGGSFLTSSGSEEQAWRVGFGPYAETDDTFGMLGLPAERSLEYVYHAQSRGDLPEEASGALVTQLFAAGKAASVLSGPWLAADLPADLRYRVVAPPPLQGRPLLPLMTVEAAFVTRTGIDNPETLGFLQLLGSVESAALRARVGRQVVTSGAAWKLPELANDPFLQGFRGVADLAVRTPRSAAMRAVWQPAERALLRVLRGGDAHDACMAAQREFDRAMRPPPPAASPWPLLVLGALSLSMALLYWRRARAGIPELSWRRSWFAWGYAGPAALATAVLVGLPLLAGAATSLFVGTQTNPTYVGLANYVEILTGGSIEEAFASGSFWFTLLVTVAWTVINVILHVGIGMLLGVLLARPIGRMRSVYRTLLILPWAIPSYVTALAWKGMFHRQLGAINALLGLFGVPPVSFFAKFSTAFAANVATNAWLGFPFMMVVVLGALTSISQDVLEAAEVDGATPWQRFRWVTLPLLKPTLLPAVVLGSVWTFNAFNVVFLVSGGEPGGETDILISEAYRWAFTREAHYGYAAAYAVLIFLLLATGTRLLNRWLTPAEDRA